MMKGEAPLPGAKVQLIGPGKMIIETKTAIMPKKQIVTCNGKRLEDGRIMADYGIRRGNKLFLTAHHIGGGPARDGSCKEQKSLLLALIPSTSCDDFPKGTRKINSKV